jgi:hypothetical protein
MSGIDNLDVLAPGVMKRSRRLYRELVFLAAAKLLASVKD